ncbi:hypothetical protein [Klebsiella oxytoca]|uniref:hypothetical protein n=1 Tax=Klebsiella oxytoca TaxID=571 RepID=UPI00157B7BE9|nr:hypothetical protein [Klebsiella oxytoca]
MIARQSEKQLIIHTTSVASSIQETLKIIGILPGEGNIFCRWFIDLGYEIVRKWGDGHAVGEFAPNQSWCGLTRVNTFFAALSRKEMSGDSRRKYRPALRRSAGRGDLRLAQ